MTKKYRLDGPIKWSNRPVLAVRYGLHWAHGKNGSDLVLREEVGFRTISGVLVNTSRGSLWLYFRNWGM